MFELIILALCFLGVLYFTYRQNKNLYDTIKEIQSRYFESLKSYSQKSDKLLEKQNKEFLKVFAQVFKKEIPIEIPRPIQSEQIENSIENNTGPEEILLTESDRIPIVEGVNLKFEDETEVYPMNINPIDQVENKAENPIEKS